MGTNEGAVLNHEWTRMNAGGVIDLRYVDVLGGRGWDGETVIRTPADRTRTFRFAGSQASDDSSFSPHAKAQRRQDEVLGK